MASAAAKAQVVASVREATERIAKAAAEGKRVCDVLSATRDEQVAAVVAYTDLLETIIREEFPGHWLTKTPDEIYAEARKEEELTDPWAHPECSQCLVDGKACHRHVSVNSEIYAELGAHPEVLWDRFVVYDGSLTAYGWIPRSDGRADFLILEFEEETGRCTDWLTSASPHPASVRERLENEQSAECQRIESRFGLPNAIRKEADRG